jgi:hypothetical protein
MRCNKCQFHATGLHLLLLLQSDFPGLHTPRLFSLRNAQTKELAASIGATVEILDA